MLNDGLNSPVTVAGPSHARRFRAAIDTGQIARPKRKINWMDVAAASMLHPDFAEANFSNGPETTLCLVPDFRLGNRSLRDPDTSAAYTRVEKGLISPENDKIMLDRVMGRVKSIRDSNPRARFVFWCLGWRELNNRTRGNHYVDGAYKHPYWNLAEVEREIGDSAISLLPMIEHPIRNKIHIDGAGHPSLLGYELFRRMVDHPELGVEAHLNSISEHAVRPNLFFPRRTILTGDSFWLQTLETYVNKGLVRIDSSVDIEPLGEIVEMGDLKGTRVCLVSRSTPEEADTNGRAETATDFASLVQNIERGHGKVTTFHWEARANVVIHPRRRVKRADSKSPHALYRDLANEGLSGKVIVESPGMPDIIRGRDVEVSNPSGPMPTLDGLLTVFRALGGDYRLEPLVL